MAFEETKNSDILSFNLINIVPLKFHENENGFTLYFLNKEPENNNYKLKSIHFDYIDQFLDILTLKLLKDNFILLENFMILKNIQVNNNLNRLDFELTSSYYSSIETKTEYFENDSNIIQEKIFNNNLTDLNIELNSFFKITGKVMDICEENCCFELNCCKCKYDLNTDEEELVK